MVKKEISASIVLLVMLAVVVSFSSCKSCNKGNEGKTNTSDSTSVPAAPHVQSAITLPHADSSLAPVFAKVMDDVFDASRKKDYVKLASYLIYRGPDMKRFGYDVFNPKNAYERNVVKITAEVFNKWNSNCETKDYARIFSLQQPDGREMDVLEVIFVSKKGVDRRFFGFLPLKKDDYKIVDVTSNLQ
jgi:hypothetical protein